MSYLTVIIQLISRPLIQNILTSLKILLIVGLATLGLLFGKGDWSNFTVVQVQSFDLMAFGTAMLMVMADS